MEKSSKHIMEVKPVHEVLTGYKEHIFLPAEELIFILSPKRYRETRKTKPILWRN